MQCGHSNGGAKGEGMKNLLFSTNKWPFLGNGQRLQGIPWNIGSHMT